MARVTTYLNFMGNTEEAFNFYKKVFGTDFIEVNGKSIQRNGDIPGSTVPEEEKDKVMHVALPILAGHVLMGTDMLKSMGHELRAGNNVTLNLEPDTLEETQRLYSELSEGATDVTPLEKMFWGAYWGTCQDKYGVRWMFNFYTEGE